MHRTVIDLAPLGSDSGSRSDEGGWEVHSSSKHIMSVRETICNLREQLYKCAFARSGHVSSSRMMFSEWRV
jgi:mevalonate pyrophosphate decarboxylase